MRAMPAVYKGAFEIRIKSKEGSFRVFHVALQNSAIIVFHAFLKKSQATPQNEIETARLRLKDYLRGRI